MGHDLHQCILTAGEFVFHYIGGAIKIEIDCQSGGRHCDTSFVNYIALSICIDSSELYFSVCVFRAFFCDFVEIRLN